MGSPRDPAPGGTPPSAGGAATPVGGALPAPYCCSGAFGPGVCSPDSWDANNSAALFKSACPDAYSYAYDDVRSTYTCGDPNPDYTITFCPKEPS